jgi:hypothetical protein
VLLRGLLWRSRKVIADALAEVEISAATLRSASPRRSDPGRPPAPIPIPAVRSNSPLCSKDAMFATSPAWTQRIGRSSEVRGGHDRRERAAQLREVRAAATVIAPLLAGGRFPATPAVRRIRA